MKIVGFLRIKNAILTISECLYNLSSLVDEIVIVDNGSTDGTLSIYSHFPKIVTVKKTQGFHEGRDKYLAHQLAKKRNPDWMIYLDADEVFEEVFTRKKLENLCAGQKYDAFGVRIFHFWLSRRHYRTDDYYFKKYTVTSFARIFKNVNYIYFDKKKKIHTWFAKGHKNMKDIKYRIKHFGFIFPEQIKAKVQLYESLSFSEDKNTYLSYKKPKKFIKLRKWHSANWPGGGFYLEVNHWYWKTIRFVLNQRLRLRRLKYSFFSLTSYRKRLLYSFFRLCSYRKRFIYYLFKLSLRLKIHQALKGLRCKKATN